MQNIATLAQNDILLSSWAFGEGSEHLDSSLRSEWQQSVQSIATLAQNDNEVCKAFNKDFTQNDVLKYFIPINPRKKRRKAWQA